MALLQALRDEFVPVLIVAALIVPYVVLVLQGLPVPEELKALVNLVVGFYFGAKAITTGRANGVRTTIERVGGTRETDNVTERVVSEG